MTIPGQTRYQPIADHLATLTGAAVVLTFTEIEALIGGPLPTTALVSSAYWTGKRLQHVRAWGQMGWRARLDRRNRCVIFTRDTGEG